MRTLDINQDLILDDGTFRVTDRAGNRVHLQNVSTGEYSTVHLGDLLPRLTELPPLTIATPRVLDHLSPADRQKVTMWATHIEEMVSGIHPEFEHARPQYDPAKTSLNERVAAKTAELKAFGIKASRSTLFEKKALFAAGGAAALLDGRAHKQVGKLDKANTRLIETITSVVARRVSASTVTESELHRLVEAELALRYGPEVTVPSRATMYRYFEALFGKKHTGKATTRRSQAGTPDRTYGTSRRMLPGQEVQIDSTVMDVLVMTKKGPQRPLLTTMIDVATRSILAYTMRLEGTKGYDHALLLAQALVPFAQRPDRSEHRALVAARFPQAHLLSPERRRVLEREYPIIVPRTIVTDNGTDYLSDVFRSACKKYEVDIIRSSIHTPTDKPHVERMFGSINTLFCQSKPGYTGGSVANRGRAPEREELLDLAALTELFDDWILSVWQNRPHNGLRDAYDSSETFSPNQWFNSHAPFAGDIELANTTDDFIDLLPSTIRTIGVTGVQHKNRYYDSVQLHPHRGIGSNRPHLGNKWEVKFNPYDVTRVWVRSLDNKWIECRWREAKAIFQPHFADITQNLHQQERNDTAYADADRAGTPIPANTLDPEVEISDHAWNPDVTITFDMFDEEED
jgi:putative transposase